jgi:hypothetical protein
LRERNNAVIAALPGTAQNATVSVMNDSGQPVVVVGVKVADDPYSPGRDIWMHYYSSEDIDMWASFLAERLAALVKRFLASARGEA